MSSLLIKQHNPLKSVYATRIDESVWQRHEEQIREMHGAKITRNQMLDVLAEDHAFNPTPGQLNARIKDWGLRVYKATSAIPTPASTLSVSAESSTNRSSPSTCFSRPQDPDDCSSATSMEDLSGLQKSDGPITDGFTELPVVASTQFTDPDMAMGNYRLAQATGPPFNKIEGPVIIARDLPPVWSYEAPAPVHALTFRNPRAQVYTTTSSRSGSSMKTFLTLAGRLREDPRRSGTSNRSDRSYGAMSIDSRES